MDEVALTLDESIQVLILGCFLTLVTSYLAWVLGFYQLPKSSDKEEELPLKTVLSSFALFLFFMILFVPFIFVLGLYLIKGHTNLNTEALVLINTCAILTTFIAFGIYLNFLSSKSRKLIFGKSFGISFNKSVKDISLGILTWFLSFPVVLIVGKTLEIIFNFLSLDVSVNQVAVSQVKDSLSSPILFSGIAISIVLFVPIIEEFLFRGCLQTWIKGKIGLTKAIFLSSFVFAAFHFSLSQGLGNIELLSSLFVLSCFLGFIYERQQSLLASISLHAFFNAVSVLVIALSN